MVKNSFSYENIFLIFYVIILVGMIYYLFYQKNNNAIQSKIYEGFSNTNNFFNKNKPIIWKYWETPLGKKKPGYIDLCEQSVIHNCGDCFTIISLDEKSIYDYIPEIQNYDLEKLSIPQKVDFYRYLLLEKYGGVWIDADIVVVKCLCDYYKHLEHVDYVGFGCGFNKKKCSQTMNGYSRPLNWMMMSRPKSDFIQCIRKRAEKKIQNQDKVDYHGIGKEILAQCHDQLDKKKNWKYHHISSQCQEYDSYGNKLNRILKPFQNQDCRSRRYFFPFYNTSPGLPDWFKELNAEELKQSSLYIQPILSEAFKPKSKCN